MLNHETTAAWVEQLVAFVNKARSPTEIGEALGLRFERSNADHIEKLRSLADRDLHMAFGETQLTLPYRAYRDMNAAQKDRLRNLAKRARQPGRHTAEERSVRSLYRPVPKSDRPAMKFNIATSWISGSSELNRDVMARVGYPLTAMEFGIGRDAQGRVRATSPQVRSFEDFVRLAIAELLSPECRVRVRVCVSRTCERLFVLRPSEGQPPKGCPGTRHADAERLRKRRDREKDLDVKAKHIAQASLGKGKRRRK